MFLNHKNQKIICLASQRRFAVAIEKCPHCTSEKIVKNGFTKSKNQRVLCKECKKSRVLHKKSNQNKDSKEIDIQAIRRSFLERLSLNGVARIFLISYYKVYKELNLCFLLLPNFKSQVAENKDINDTIEFDRVFPMNYVDFVKKNL